MAYKIKKAKGWFSKKKIYNWKDNWDIFECSNGDITFRNKLNPYRDNITISKSDYPFKNHWEVKIDTKNTLAIPFHYRKKQDAIDYAKNYMARFKN